MWIRAASTWEIGFQPIIQAKYRLHSSNVSAGIDQKKNLKANIAVFKALESKSRADSGLLGKPRNLALIELWLAHHYYLTGEDALAAAALKKAFSVDQSLCSDSAFLKTWLDKLTAVSLQSAADYDAKADIPLRVLAEAYSAQIPIDGSFRKHFGFLQFASQAIQHYQKNRLKRAGYYSMKSLAASPKDWLHYHALRGILMESVAGTNTAELLRGFKRKLMGR
jgi:hypothetical protein